MSSAKLQGLLTIVSILAMAGVPALAGPCENTGNPADMDNCFILRAAKDKHQGLANGHGLTKKKDVAASDLDVILVQGPANLLPETTLANLQADPDVVEAEPATLEALAETSPEAELASVSLGTIDSLYATGVYTGPEAAYFTGSVWNGYLAQPAAGLIQLALARDAGVPESYGEGTVAIIDTGVDPDHAALQGALVPGYDFLLDQPGIASEWEAIDPAARAQAQSDLTAAGDQSYSTVIEGGADTVDETTSTKVIADQSYSTVIESQALPAGFGHGTMVAGIVRLVAPNAKIMPIRVFNGDGTASLADIIEAIYWAVDNGADAINMSFSVAEHSSALQRAILYAKKNKVVLVSSAGNKSGQALTYPAAYGEVASVGSTNLQDEVSAFSNRGPHVLLGAPGEGIVTLYPGNLYAGAWGTSFSAAFVTGTAALLTKPNANGWVYPNVNQLEVKLEDSADALAATSTETLGSGRLDAEGAFHLRNNSPDID